MAFSYNHNGNFLAINYLYIGAVVSSIGAFLYLKNPRPEPRLSLHYMLMQRRSQKRGVILKEFCSIVDVHIRPPLYRILLGKITSAVLIILSNIMLMFDFRSINGIMLSTTLCVCYVILIVLHHKVVTSIHLIIDAERTIDGEVNNDLPNSRFTQAFDGLVPSEPLIHSCK